MVEYFTLNYTLIFKYLKQGIRIGIMSLTTSVLAEVTTVSKASSKFESLRTTIPRSIVKHWRLEEGDKLEWDWKVIDGKMNVIINMVKTVQKQ